VEVDEALPVLHDCVHVVLVLRGAALLESLALGGLELVRYVAVADRHGPRPPVHAPVKRRLQNHIPLHAARDLPPDLHPGGAREHSYSAWHFHFPLRPKIPIQAIHI
jgi:hypothetical protein